MRPADKGGCHGQRPTGVGRAGCNDDHPTKVGRPVDKRRVPRPEGRRESAVPDATTITRPKYGAPWTKEGATARGPQGVGRVRWKDDHLNDARRPMNKRGCHGQRPTGVGRARWKHDHPTKAGRPVRAHTADSLRSLAVAPFAFTSSPPDESRTPGARPHCRLAALAGSGTLRCARRLVDVRIADSLRPSGSGTLFVRTTTFWGVRHPAFQNEKESITSSSSRIPQYQRADDHLHSVGD